MWDPSLQGLWAPRKQQRLTYSLNWLMKNFWKMTTNEKTLMLEIFIRGMTPRYVAPTKTKGKRQTRLVPAFSDETERRSGTLLTNTPCQNCEVSNLRSWMPLTNKRQQQPKGDGAMNGDQCHHRSRRWAWSRGHHQGPLWGRDKYWWHDNNRKTLNHKQLD